MINLLIGLVIGWLLADKFKASVYTHKIEDLERKDKERDIQFKNAVEKARKSLEEQYGVQASTKQRIGFKFKSKEIE